MPKGEWDPKLMLSQSPVNHLVMMVFSALTVWRVLLPGLGLVLLIGVAVLILPLAGDVAAQDADKTPIDIAFSPASLTVREGNPITVTVSVPAGTNGAVSYRTKGNDTAASGEDFESIQGTLYLGTGADGDGNARALSHDITIQTIWDLVPESSAAPEVFTLEFFGVEGEFELPNDLKSNFIRITQRPAPITVNYNSGTGLANGDYGLELWDDGDTQAEKDRDKVSFRINAPAEAVSTSARSLMSYEISSSTDPGKASAADYTISDKDGTTLPASGSLQFPPDATEQVIWVTPVDDPWVELPETFTLTLSNPQHGVEFPDLDGDGAADSTLTVVGTIYSGNDVVEMHVDNVTVMEGKTAKLVATLDRALAEGESARAEVMVSDAGCRRRTTYPQPTPGVDYREVEPTQLIFGAGDQSKTFAIPTFDDFLDEPEECLGVEFGNFRGIKSVSNPTPQKGGQTLELGGFGIWASAFIADNDDPPTLFVSPGEVDEPDDGETATLQYRVQLSNPSARKVTVDYAEDSGSGQKDPATSGTDYTALTAGTLTFLPGEFSKTVDIEVTGDYDEEPDESVTVQFSNLVNACFPGAGNCPSGPITSTGIIHNDDQNLELSFTLDDPTIVEGEDAVLRLTISHPIGYDVMAGVSTVDGTATADSDFKAAGRMGYSVRVPKGSTEATQSVPVLADSVSGEGIEKFSFKLDTLLLFPEGDPAEETPTAVTDEQKLKEIFGSGFAVADIRTNSPMPTASIVDGPALSVAAVKDTVTEGWPAQFEITLDPPATTDVTFTWRTGNGGLDDGGSDAHKAKAGKDYTSTTATPVTIPAGETSVSLPEIPTLQDTVDEMDQQFMVALESITGAVADEERGVVTIRDDDSRPWISIADATVEEGGELSFTITLEGTSENEVSVLWVTEDDTATTLDHDYVGVERRRTVNFAPGEQTKTITVQTLEDRAPETTEQFKVQLAHARHAKYRDPTAVGTITDNDLMEISIADAAPVTEGSGAAAEFTVTLTPEQTSPVTIQWQTQDGPGGGFYVAKSGGDAAQGLNDFTAVTSGSLTFAPGETEKTVSVTILDDTAYESIERFGVVVSGDATAMLIRKSTAYGEIQDDDAKNLIMHQPLPAVVEEGKTYVVHFKLPPRTEDARWTVGRLGFINCYLDDYSFLGFPHPGTPLSEANARDFALAHSKDGVSGEGKLDPANAGYYINYPCSGVAKREGVTAHIFAEDLQNLEEHNFAVFVKIYDDFIAEGNEVASMWLVGHGGEFWTTMSPHLFWNGFALTTIIVDNDLPQASVSDVRVGEDAGNAILTISLSQASTKEVKVSYETRNGTAIAGQDYGNQDNTVTFSPGETEKTISIPINADHLVEPLPETFTVALKDPSEGLLDVHPVDGEATVTITDSTERKMTIPDRVVDEGEDVEILAKFSDPIAYGVGWFNRIALFFRGDGLRHPATANDDYVEFDGNLLSETTLLLDGDNRVAKTLTTNEDSAIETDEDIGVYARFTIPISQGLVYDSSRTSRITIRDDDHASLMIAGLDSAGDVTVKAGQIWTAPTPSITGRPLGHVTWTLEGDDADDFSIDPDTGEVTLSDRDFENPTDKDKDNIYRATVRATDEDGNTDTAAVQVTAGGRSLVLSKNSVTVAEKAGTDSFTVALDSQPTGDITVALTTTGETGALTLDQTELTFKPGDWNQAQTVTVTGVDDKVDNADDKREASITLVASGRGFAATVEYTVAATVTDDDDKGITFSKKALSVAENGGTDSYTIVLDTEPTGDVTVTVRGVNTAPLLSVDTATLVFGPTDWDQPQTVTFTGGNDDLDNLKNPRYVITHGAQHADYEGFAAGSVTVTVTDDDVRGVTISKEAVEVNAGDTAEYTVVLNSQPHTGDGFVTIKLEVNPKARGATDSQYISPTTLTFNSGNWNTPQTVTITGAKPGNLVFLYEITHQVSGADYTGVKAGTVQVANRDKDHVQTGDDLTVKSSSAVEGNAVVFTVTRRDDTVPALNWRTGGYQSLILPPLTAADPDSDYTSNHVVGGNIVRFEGKDTVTLSVPTTDDDLDEVNEAFTVGIVSYVDKNQGTEGAESLALNHRYAVIGTIIDDDAAALSVAAPAVDEGEKAQVTISLSNPSINDVTVKWNTAADTRDDASPATADTDYTAVPTAQTVTIKAGATSAVVEVQTTEDSALEGNETFLVELSSPTNAALPEAAATAVVTITDNDGAPTVSVGDAAAVTEGDDPETTVNLSFPVTLSAVSGQQVTVTYTLGGTATADDDYTDPATKSVSIAAGTRTANIVIPVKGDLVDERNETVVVTLTGATNATVSSVEGADEGEGTITDDDAAQLSIADGSGAEGSAVSFTIGLDPVSDRTVTVQWNTANDAGGTHPATAGTDYTAVSPARTATIAAGTASTTVTVQTTQDSLDEPDETFLVELSAPVNAALASGKDQATGTITDDDAAQLSIADGSGAEGSAVSFTIGLDPVSDRTVTVQWNTANDAGGTHPATAGTDYTAVSPARTATIAAGAASTTVTVQTTQDSLDEPDETFLVELSAPVNAALASGKDQATGTITDNDTAPTLKKATIVPSPGSTREVAENVANAPTMTFTVSLSGTTFNTDQTVTMSVGQDGDLATSGVDYTAVSDWTLTIPAGASNVQGSFTLDPIDDALDEANETLTLTATLPGVDIPDLTFTIIDDDAAPTVSVGDAAAVTEGNDPNTTVDLSFPVTLSAVSGQQVTVTYTLGGTATADDDYADPAAKSLTIPAGTRTANILIPVKGDLVDELNETVTVTLSGATNATVSSTPADLTGEGTITDDDGAQLSVADGSGAEGGAVSFAIGLDPVSDRTVTVKWNTANDASGDHPATAGTDYTAVSPARTATIAAGAASTTVTVQTTEDTLVEPDETFLLELSSPTNATLAAGKDQATGTITDDDEAPEVSITGGSGITEGGDAEFTVTASPAPVAALPVDVRITADGYFGVATGRRAVTIPTSGSATLTVSTEDDELDEIDGLIIGTLQAGSDYRVSSTQGSDTVTVADDDPTGPAEATVSFEKASYTFNEDDNNAFVKVVMDNALTSAIAVRFQAHSTDAGIGPDGDVEISLADLSRGELGPRDIIFAPGETSREIMLDLLDDDVVEPDETLTISLSAVSGPVATGASTTVTLTDDDRAVIIIDPRDSGHPLTVQVEEGGQGTIWVQMNKPHQEDVEMDCVVRGSATPGEDYVTLHHRVTIPAGSEALAVTLNTIDDNLVEGLETFIFIIANPVGSGVSIDPEQSEHTMNIMDNDDSPATPEISITAGSGITEGGDAEFTVKVSPAPSAALPVKVTVVATSGFGAAGTGQRTVTIPTSGSATFTVGTVDDAVDEPDGSITGTLQAGSAYRVSSTQGSATVKVADDDEPVPAEAVVSFEKASYTLDEDDNVLSIKVVMDKAITSEVTVLLRMHSTDSEAGRGGDAYMYPADQYFSFAPGETSREIAVYPVDNDVVEPDETFTISIDVSSGPVTAGAPTTVTLTDDDEGVIFIDPQNITRQVEEGERGVIGVYMSKANQEDVTVDFVVGGTATAGADYVALPHRATIPAGATYFVATVNTIDDELGEGTETIEFSLANPVGNSVSLEPNLSDHTVKILDNDPFAPEASIVALTDSIIEGEVAYFRITLDPAPIVSFPVSITTVHSNNYETSTSSKIVDVPAGGVVKYSWHPWDDDDHETGETLEMRLNPDATYTVSSTQGSATVNMVDNDLPKPVVSITGGGDIIEGGDATFTIAASPAHPDAPSGDLSVNVSITVIGAYEITKESETVTVSPGGSVTLTIATTDDSLDELDGSIDATLIWGDGYTVSRTQDSATVNVIDNDWPKPVVSITGGSDIAEGGDAGFTITAGAAHPDAPAADLSVNVSIEVVGDYGVTTESETVTVSPGGSATLTIATTDDSLDELDGSITATLESGEGYTVSSTKGSATVNVVDDDLPKPVVSITGGSDIAEGGDAEFTITASPAHPDAPSADLSVNVSIEVAGNYGVATESETVTVSPGGSATLTIATTGDTLDELDGSITATLESGDGYTVSSTQGSATVNVVDDDLPKPVVSITGGSGVTEGGAAEFTITASPAHPDAPSADLSVNVSIEVAGDYGVATESETVTVSPGGSATLTIATTGDTLDELDGSITATLESGDGYTVSSTEGSATVNVVDDDASPTVSVEDASGFEDSFLEFRVTLSEVSGREVQVGWYTLPSETLDNRAHMTDYDTMSGRLVFAPGVTVMTGKVNLKQDTEDEEDECFTVWLENPDGATIAREKATMTIKDAE